MHNFLHPNFILCNLLERERRRKWIYAKKLRKKFQSDYSIYVLQHNFFFYSSYAAIILLTCMKNYVYFSWHEFFLLLISCHAICLALTPSHSLCVSFLSLSFRLLMDGLYCTRDKKKWEKQAPVMENSVGKRMRSGCASSCYLPYTLTSSLLILCCCFFFTTVQQENFNAWCRYLS